MGWLTKLSGKTVALDTSPLIYFMEENPVFLDAVKPFFAAGTCTASITSSMAKTQRTKAKKPQVDLLALSALRFSVAYESSRDKREFFFT